MKKCEHKKQRKILLIAMIVATYMLMATACGTDNNDNSSKTTGNAGKESTS